MTDSDFNLHLKLITSKGIQVKTTHLTPFTITINHNLLKYFHMYIISFICSKILTRQEICLTHLHIFCAVQPGNWHTLTYLDKLGCNFNRYSCNYLIINNKYICVLLYIYNRHIYIKYPPMTISEKILLSPC